MRARIVWILTALAVLAAVASAFFLLRPSFLSPHQLALKEEGLLEGEAISVKTGIKAFGVHMGDSFSYFVEVRYDPNLVSDIDRTSLEQGLNLEPFEIRDLRETESDLDSRTRVYRREYEIQLIRGEVGVLYEFPSLVVRYRPKDTDGLFEKTVVPEAIFITPGLPSDVTGLELRPLKGEVEDVSRERLPWILWTLGGFLAALAVGDLGLRVIPLWREGAGRSRKADVLAEAYCSLAQNVETGVEPKLMFHQMECIARMVLARKENIDWLEEPNLDGVCSGIRPSVISLFEACQEAYRPETVERNDVADALRQLEEILCFYFGEGDIAVWTS